MFVSRRGGLETMAGYRLYEEGQLLHMAWVEILRCLCGRVVGPIDVSQRGRPSLTSGRRTRMSWCDSHGLRTDCLVQLGLWTIGSCGAATRGQVWYVEVVTWEGGVGGLRKARQSEGKFGRRPQYFSSFDGVGFVSCGR